MDMNQWLKDRFVKPSHCEICLEIMNAMLDGESSGKQEFFLIEHIDQCDLCFQNYDVELAIRKLIKMKLQNKPVPEGLIESIKTKVRGIA